LDVVSLEVRRSYVQPVTAEEKAVEKPYDQALLDRFRPRLVYDGQYDYRATAAETIVDNPGNLLCDGDGDVIARSGGTPPLTLDLLTSYPDGREPAAGDFLCEAPLRMATGRQLERKHGQCVYGRVLEQAGRTWLQYWLWLYDNPKNILGIGRHEGDWEFIQVGLDKDGRPELLTYSQHTGGQAKKVGRKTRRHEQGDEWHPCVYVAPLSHACYFKPHTYVYKLGIDHPYGDGPARTAPVRPFGSWAMWPGRWGNPEHAVAGLGAGPQSPGRQGIRWNSPGEYHAKCKRRLPRVFLGAVVRFVGWATFPRRPDIDARRTVSGIEVRYRLRGWGLRRARHINVTVHEEDHVIRSKVVRKAPRSGVVPFRMAEVPSGCVVHASAFNRLVQRSGLAGPAEVRQPSTVPSGATA
jgi:hypothetical protein